MAWPSSPAGFGAAADADLIIVPGLGDSDGEHWQTLWQQAHPRARRIRPGSFDRPDVDDWVAAIEREVTQSATPVLVAHSAGCLAIAEYAARGGRAVAALAVAPPDPRRPDAPDALEGFRDLSIVPAGFAVVAVASRDDPYGAYDRAVLYARLLGAELVDAGPRGHLNSLSGLGDWPEGRELLDALVASAVS